MLVRIELIKTNQSPKDNNFLIQLLSFFFLKAILNRFPLAIFLFTVIDWNSQLSKRERPYVPPKKNPIVILGHFGLDEAKTLTLMQIYV
jgi:hypothetical protein